MMNVLLILVPLLTALLVALTRKSSRLVQATAFIGGVATFLLTLNLDGAEPFIGRWLPGVGVSFALDSGGASAVLLLVAALVMIPTLQFASKQGEQSGAFVALLLVAHAGLNGIFLARDLVVFYVFWEATLIPGLIMLGLFGGQKRVAALVKYLVYAVLGSFVMLIAIIATKTLSGAASFHITDLMIATTSLTFETQVWLFIGFAVGMAVKLPIWPLHSWLITFNEENHHSGVADIFGTLYKVGGFGFFLWALPMLPLGAEAVSPYLLALGVITAVYGAFAAAGEKHLKRFLAYASLSHMGIVAAGLFALDMVGASGAIYLLAAQMASTGALFLMSGFLYRRYQTFDLAAYGGLAKSAPAFAAISLLMIFASIGVPGLSNFPGEFMALMGTFQTSTALGVLAIATVITAGAYGVNLYHKIFLGGERAVKRDLSAFELALFVPFIVSVIWLGFFSYPHLRNIDQHTNMIEIQMERAHTPTLEPLAQGGAK